MIRHISDICIPPTCITGSHKFAKEHKDILELKFEAIKVALFSDPKSLQDKAIDTILGDLVTGAYQDKLVLSLKNFSKVY